ncbi:hypothetical protein [Oceanospirillum sanctuarii]|uniref:hypothetical protein n=1 Tax=Oceanospirillum sanctuarii TaxID=1434821 RepID=UPI000A3ADB7E|nr:hypothetical protein [Oceanospirillum sanctuarii]
MRLFTLILTSLLATFSLSACAYDGKKPMAAQDQLPAHLKTGKQIRIENSHYLILDQVKAYNTQNRSNQRAVQSNNAEIGRKGNYSIQSKAIASADGRPVVWNQSTQRFAVLLDELGLVLNDNGAANAIAKEYGMTLTVQIERLNRAYFNVDANQIPDLMRQLQQDIRVKAVMPSLLENSRQPM